jgi:hypothetical protein
MGHGDGDGDGGDGSSHTGESISNTPTNVLFVSNIGITISLADAL